MNTVTIITMTGDILVYHNIINFTQLINIIDNQEKLFCLVFYNTKVFHSLQDIQINHTLQDTYYIYYLPYDRPLILRIKEMKNSLDAGFIETEESNISNLFEQKILYNDDIFLEFLASNLSRFGNWRFFSFIDDDIRNNSDAMIKLFIASEYNILKYASEELKNNRDFILKAVKNKGCALKNAHNNLKNDKEIVLEAVKQDGHALEHASYNLQNDKDIVLEAVKQNGFALRSASEELKKDKEIVLEAIKKNGHTLKYASDDLRNDREFILDAMRQNVSVLWYASISLLDNKKFIIDAVKYDSLALNYLSDDLRNNKEILDGLKSYKNEKD